MTSDEPGELSTKGEAVRSTINFLRICKMSQSATAPEKMRRNVKLAASMLVFARLDGASSDALVIGALALSGVGLGVSSPPLRGVSKVGRQVVGVP